GDALPRVPLFKDSQPHFRKLGNAPERVAPDWAPMECGALAPLWMGAERCGRRPSRILPACRPRRRQCGPRRSAANNTRAKAPPSTTQAVAQRFPNIWVLAKIARPQRPYDFETFESLSLRVQ